MHNTERKKSELEETIDLCFKAQAAKVQQFRMQAKHDPRFDIEEALVKLMRDKLLAMAEKHPQVYHELKNSRFHLYRKCWGRNLWSSGADLHANKGQEEDDA